MSIRGLPPAALALVLSAGAALAQSKPVDELSGRVTEKNYLRLERFVASHVDRVVGLKLTIKKSGTDDKLDASESDGQFVVLLPGQREPKSEIVANEGFELRGGDYVFDGFFLVKYGGFRQGTKSYALSRVDEAKVRLSNAKIKTVRLK